MDQYHRYDYRWNTDIDSIRHAPLVATNRYFDIHGAQYHDVILNQCIDMYCRSQ